MKCTKCGTISTQDVRSCPKCNRVYDKYINPKLLGKGKPKSKPVSKPKIKPVSNKPKSYAKLYPHWTPKQRARKAKIDMLNHLKALILSKQLKLHEFLANPQDFMSRDIMLEYVNNHFVTRAVIWHLSTDSKLIKALGI